MFQLADKPFQTLLLNRNTNGFAVDFPVDRVSINGRELELTTEEEIQPGQFRIADQRVDYLPFADSPQNFYLKYSVATAPEPSSIPISGLLRQLGCGVEAKIVETKAIQGHPSLQITVTDDDDRLSFYEGLEIGKKIFSFNGMRYRLVAPKTIVKNHIDDKIIVRLNFRGIWASFGTNQSPLDIPIRLSEFGDCHHYSNEVSLQSLAAKVGVRYIGRDVRIKNYQNSPETTVTVRQVLEERAAYVGGFAYYSNPNAIEIRRWKPRTHVLPICEKLEKGTFTFSGENQKERGVELASIYRNAEIKLDWQEAEAQRNREEDLEVKWSYNECQSFSDLQSPAEPIRNSDGGITAYQMPGSDTFRNPSNAFDNGGFTKFIEREVYRRGILIQVTRWVWGWVFTSLDYYQVILNSDRTEAEIRSDTNFYKFDFFPRRTGIASFWRQVEFSDTQYIFDEQGYLVEEITTGRRLGRLLQDNSDVPAIRAREEYFELNRQKNLVLAQPSPDAELANTLEQQAAAKFRLSRAYKFDRVFPINVRKTYTLRELADHFPEIIPPANSECFYIPPKYVALAKRVEENILVEPNPESTEDNELLPIIVGYKKTFTEKTEITDTRGRGKFRRTTTSKDERGRGLQGKISIKVDQPISGKPRKQIILPRTQPSDTEQRSRLSNYERNRNKKFLITTSGVEQPDRSPGQTLSEPLNPIVEQPLFYKDVDNLSDAIAIAELKLNIQNSLNSYTFSRTADELPNIDEGDIAIDDGKSWVVKGIETTHTYQKQEFAKEQKLSLGFLCDSGTSLETIISRRSAVSAATLSLTPDGRIRDTNNIYNDLNPETARRAAELGLLEDYAERTGQKVYGSDELQDPDKDLLDEFLQDSNGGAGDLSGLGQREPKPPIDLREKSDREAFTDLVNRISLLEEFNNTLKDLVNEEFGSRPENQIQGEINSGGGGGGSSSGGNNIADFEDPTRILEGGDEFLTDLLNNLLSGLQNSLGLLQGESASSGGGGSAGGAGSGSGSEGGSGGSAVGEPVFQVGNLTIFAPTPDIDGILTAILRAIEEAILLAQNFNFTLPTLTDAIAESTRANSASGTAGGGGASGGSSSGGGNTGGGVTVVFTQPEGVEPATIRTIFPDNLTLDDVDLSAIFEALDFLLGLLDAIANATFDFDLDLSLLEPQAGLALTSSQQVSQTNSASFSGANSASNANTASGSSTASPGGVIYRVAEIEDISGVVGGGLTGATNFPSSWEGGSSPQLNQDNFNFGENSNSSGNPGEFTQADGDFNNAAPEYVTNPVEIVSATPTGFYYPVSATDPQALDVEPYLDLPSSLTILVNSATIIQVENLIANDLVFWELAESVPGVEILTPYDFCPSIEFTDSYNRGSIDLVVSMRSHSLSATLRLNTTPQDPLPLADFDSSGEAEIAGVTVGKDDLEVVLSAVPPGTAITGAASATFAWQPINLAEGYYVEELVGESYQRSQLLSEPSFVLEALKTYRIITVFEGWGEFVGGAFSFDSFNFIVGADSLSLADFDSSGDDVAIAYTDPPVFFIGITNIAEEDPLSLNDFDSSGEDVVINYVEPSVFFVAETAIAEEDPLALADFDSSGEDVVIDYVEPSVFFI